jgi:GTP-binding protein HflX
VAFSATTGDGVEELLHTMAARLRALTNVVELAIPYDRGDVLAAVHREGEVLSEQADESGMLLHVRLDDASLGQFVAYVVP